MSAPLLLVGHGTVDATGVAEFVAFTDRMRGLLAADGRRRRRRVHRAVRAHRPPGLDGTVRARAREDGGRADGAGRRPGTRRVTSRRHCSARCVRDPATATSSAARSARTRVLQQLLAARVAEARPRAGHGRAARRSWLHRPGRERRGLQGRAAAAGGPRRTTSSSPRSSRSPARTCPPGSPAAGRWARVGSWWRPTSCSTACCRAGWCDQARAFAAEHPDVDVRVAGLPRRLRRSWPGWSWSATARRCTATSG